MKPILRTITFLAVFPLIAAPTNAAINDWENGSPTSYGDAATKSSTRQSQTRRTRPTGTEKERALSFSVFYGNDQSDNDVDIGGIEVRYTARPDDNARVYVHGTPITPELFAAFRLGYGDDSTKYGDYASYYDCDISEVLMSFSVGGSIRARINSVFSAFIRAEVGIAFEYLELDYEYYEEFHYKGDDSEIGLMFGVGFGIQADIDEDNGILFAVDWFKTTCHAYDSYGAEKPEYITVSVGYMWFF